MTATLTRSVEDIARDLVEKCRQGDFDGAQKACYADDIVSVESMEMPGQPREIRGMDAIRRKSEQWYADTEVHSCTVSDPLVSDDEFAVTFDMDVTSKSRNERFQMKELAVYEVRDGKITREQFFYKAD